MLLSKVCYNWKTEISVNPTSAILLNWANDTHRWAFIYQVDVLLKTAVINVLANKENNIKKEAEKGGVRDSGLFLTITRVLSLPKPNHTEESGCDAGLWCHGHVFCMSSLPTTSYQLWRSS